MGLRSPPASATATVHVLHYRRLMRPDGTGQAPSNWGAGALCTWAGVLGMEAEALSVMVGLCFQLTISAWSLSPLSSDMGATVQARVAVSAPGALGVPGLALQYRPRCATSVLGSCVALLW